ncbi:Beta-1,3-galactosyltransferase 2 [Halotydeus destructor]|nr:Beta-1,3-galactosyltransferase 2 [Halotydeus destructor]
MVFAGQRLLTFFAMTSLVVTMMLVTRYSVIFSESQRPFPRLSALNYDHVTAQRLTSANGGLGQDASSSRKPVEPVAGVSSDKPVSENQSLRTSLGRLNLRQYDVNLLPSSSSSSAFHQSRTSSASAPSVSWMQSANKPSSPATPASSSTSVKVTSSTAAKVTSAFSVTSRGNATSTSKAPPRTKITFTKDELRTTEAFTIDKPLFCDTDKGAAIDLMVVVTSAVTHFEAREAIRKTWGAFAVERGSLLLFLLGSSLDATVQDQVYREEGQYNDILQGSFIDDYYNLTLKTISLMRWVNSTCSQVKYVLKVDDDMFVNMQMMVDFSETRTFNKAIIGKLARKWKPHREAASKWYVPQSAFNGTMYPNFATGPAYMFTGDAAQQLLETSLALTPIYLEDVYMTGIVAEKAKVRRLNHALMKNVRLKVDACTFKRFITSHKHTPQEIVQLWKTVYEAPAKPCFEPKMAAKKAVPGKPGAAKSSPKSSQRSS